MKLRNLIIGIQNFKSLLLSTIHAYFEGKQDRKVIRIGLNFASQTRNVEKWVIDK